MKIIETLLKILLFFINPPQGGGGGTDLGADISESELTSGLQGRLATAEYFVRGTTTSASSIELDAGLSVSSGVAGAEDAYLVLSTLKNSGTPASSTSIIIRFTGNSVNVDTNLDVGAATVTTCGGVHTIRHGAAANSVTQTLFGSKGSGNVISDSATGDIAAAPMTEAHTISIRGRSGDAGVTLTFAVLIIRFGGTA